MTMIPIEADESKNTIFMANEDCKEIAAVYPAFYRRVGFNPPWIGYFFRRGDELVGSGGYKGKPRDGKIEIAYSAFKNFEGQGIGTEICRHLVALSLQTDSKVIITARTLPHDSASTTILKRNGFRFLGTVYDEEDGDVWEWHYPQEITR